MNGLYGTIRPANVKPEDVDIVYTYRRTRSESAIAYETLESSCLIPTIDAQEIPLEGLYNLRLPLNVFNEKGIYTIYIKPKERKTTIADIGILAIDSSVTGVVFRSEDVDGNEIPNDLTGYRVEYYDSDDYKVHSNMTRLITSCNYCSQIRMLTGTNYAKAIRYNLTSSDANDLLFCTVTPSSISSFNPNGAPSIGSVGQSVKLVHTKFNPILLEVELVDHDADTITTLLEGDQIRDLDHGIITTYNDDKEIYRQHEYYTLKSQNGVPLYDVKVKRDVIDTTQKYDNIVID